MIPLEEAARQGTPVGLERPLRVVAAGGGTGLPRVLQGLTAGPAREHERPIAVTAIVTTADDGGSSGELRRRYGVPAPGDVRNCLVALAEGLNPLAAVFQHRFGGEGGLTGHPVGNLVLTALAQRLGDFSAAVEEAGRMLGVRGRVLAAALEPVALVAKLEDGRVIRGESAIAAAEGRVGQLALAPPVDATPEAVEDVLAAELVVYGPGSLYTSVLASLLPRGLSGALAQTGATRVLVVNLFTEPGETDGFTAADHVRAVRDHLGDVVDVALVHDAPIPPAVAAAQAAAGAHPVRFDRAAIERLGVAPLTAELLGQEGRHDPAKLARALRAVARFR